MTAPAAEVAPERGSNGVSHPGQPSQRGINTTCPQHGRTHTHTMSQRTITLSNRPPVRINEEDWPVVASATDKEFDNQYEFQANRISKWFVAVRQHEDGRALVYATYGYTSNWQNSRDYAAKSGQLLAKDCDTAMIIAAIQEVCGEISQCEHYGEDADRWSTLERECIADMPAEDI